MINERNLIVVSGPSGCGKDTVVKELMKLCNKVKLSVSCTTRKPRGNEIDKESYYFLTREEFKARIDSKRMLEYTEYAGNLYGTPMDELEEKMVGDSVVVLIIEVKGAKNVKTAYPDSMCAFIVPPSIEALEERLRKRCTEDEENIKRRLEIAREELKELDYYDIAIENLDADVCAKKLLSAIESWRSRPQNIK
ncbi:MAG: guanylate kinase [Oscillospiraceae bacterium]